MNEYQQRAENIVQRLEHSDEMRPADELEMFRSVLDELTAMLNEQDTLPGTGSAP